MAIVVFLLMFSVITWDLSDQSLPAGGIEEPQGVATDGNWMATIDNRSTGPVMIVHDLSDLSNNWELLNGSIDLDSPYTITGSHLAVANQSNLVLFNLNDITDDLQPVLIIPMQRPDDVLLTGAGAVQYIITLSNGNLSAFDTSGNGVPLGFRVVTSNLSVRTDWNWPWYWKTLQRTFNFPNRFIWFNHH